MKSRRPGRMISFAAVLPLALCGYALGMIMPTEVFAQAPPQQYAVKFVCGRAAVPSPGPMALPVAPGTYFTAINVHNTTERPVGLKKKIAIAPAAGEKGGPVSQFVPAELGPDQALEVDCQDIFRESVPIGALHVQFLKGFVVIISPVELDVVAVYTAAGSTGQVQVLEVEQVPGRSLK